TLAVAWIGHATVLLRIGGLTILTDPVLSSRIGLGLGFFTGGPKRHVAPALNIAELPPIDLILISHAHFDHLDRPTLYRLPKHIPIVTASHTRDLIVDLGFDKITEMPWGEKVQVGSLTLTARPVKHWGARTFYDLYRGYNGYLIESPERKVLYAGDTAYCESFRDLPAVDLAIFGIGAYNPYIAAHATPEQVLSMADDCRAERILPMHHSTFRLSHEPMEEPIERMQAAVGSNADRLVVHEVGQQWAD
ncbi:MAG TPA: MBL fold metallo-hydrolase, partial [Tepidisphaeraceae bacterium]|nr:MBL fold metallo-hydrolase [Tepidisphaeraceae bacterium]